MDECKPLMAGGVNAVTSVQSAGFANVDVKMAGAKRKSMADADPLQATAAGVLQVRLECDSYITPQSSVNPHRPCALDPRRAHWCWKRYGTRSLRDIHV